MRDLIVAREILNQLGGHKFIVMVGAFNLAGDDNFLQFSFKGCSKYNKCRIELEPNDTYKFMLYKFHKFPNVVDFEPLVNLSYIYFDQLTGIFERETGLRTSL